MKNPIGLRPGTSLALVFVLAACGGPGAPAPAAPPPATTGLAEAAGSITGQDVYDRIAFLASDEMRGRDTPSPELERAAEYITGEFRSMGLRPAGDGSDFVQRFPISEISVDPSTVRMRAEGPPELPALTYGEDFFAFVSPSDSTAGSPAYFGPASHATAQLPFEARGRIVVVTLDPELGADLFATVQQAERVGAVGVLFVLHPVHTAEVVQQVARNVEGLGIELPLPAFALRHDRAIELFHAAGVDPELLAGRSPPASAVPLPETTLQLILPAVRVEHRVPNVAAVLRGSDPALRDEYVVISAHFDHVGVGPPDASGDSIYNGADDNASGTAVLLEVAEAFSQLSVAPARSVLFLAVSGEEKGLLGALHFAEHPTVPIESIVGNINMDMVGRNAPDTLVAIGEEYTTLGPLARRIAAEHPELGLNIVSDPDPAEQAFFRSDHAAFLKHDIPAIFFTSWLHDDYHLPSDTVEKIGTEKTASIGRLVFFLAHAVAMDPERPGWIGGGLEEVREIMQGMPF